jgi:MoaA/NifB/PqqE/SkfB family radical SAM enzyme
MIVVWRVNTHCNLNCGFCFYAREQPVPRIAAKPAEILTFAATLAAYHRETGNRVLVSWLGGEPFLWLALLELSAALVNDFGLEVSATTNGTSLGSHALRARIIRDFRELTLSVDGPARFHNEVRQWARGFERLAADVRSLLSERHSAGKGPLIRVNTVLMRDNVELFPELCQELSGWGVEEISFNALGSNDRPEFYRMHHLLPHQVSWLEAELPKLRRSLSGTGVRLAGSPAYLTRLHASAAGKPLPIADCRPGEQFLFITEGGVVSPCSFTSSEYGIPIAELSSVESLLSVPKRFSEIRLAAPSARCADCPSTQIFGKFVA